MSEELPKGWVKTKLGEVCSPVETIRPEDSPHNEFTYFDIGGIDNERNRIAETKTLTQTHFLSAYLTIYCRQKSPRPLNLLNQPLRETRGT